MTEKDTFVKKLREKFPYITKYFDKIDLIEKLHLKFCKSTLGVNSKATNLAVYSELGIGRGLHTPLVHPPPHNLTRPTFSEA